MEERPETASQRIKFGHWEGDPVAGIRDGRGSVGLTPVEKPLWEQIAILIPEKTSEAGMGGVKNLRDCFGKPNFPRIPIAVENGLKFSDFPKGKRGVPIRMRKQGFTLHILISPLTGPKRKSRWDVPLFLPQRKVYGRTNFR